MTLDESTADDGAMFRFWAFVLRRRATDPEFGRHLEDPDAFRAALEAWATEEGD